MIYTCPRCNSRFQSDSLGVVECPSCKGMVMLEGGASKGCPWDNERGGNWMGSFFKTFSRAILEPTGLFREVASGTGIQRPYIYVLIVFSILFLVAVAYQAGFQVLAVSMEFGDHVRGGIFPGIVVSIPFIVIGAAIFFVIGIPIITAMMVFFRAGLYHLCLMILGAARRDFQATCRTVCYAASPQLLQIVPILGGLVAWVWQIVLEIIGLKVVHETTYGKSALAVFLPTILCCGGVLLLVAAVAGGIVAAFMSGAGS